MDEREISIWSNAVDYVMFCVPPESRLDVLNKVKEKEEERQREPEVIRFFDIDPEEFQYWNAEKEAASLIVQVLMRSITNSHSPDGAAKVLFREHRKGTGSGWLPDYLDGLPGIVVDRKECAKIAESNGKSKLARDE